MISTEELTRLIIEGIHDRKGRGVTVVDMSHIESAAAQRFIIAQGTSTMQVMAIAESVVEYVRTHTDPAVKPYNEDGAGNAEWIVIDYGNVWVHIFMPEARLRYSLEDLWGDAVITDIPDLD